MSIEIKNKVKSILDDAVTRGLEFPSLRAIRAQIGKGSYSTIAEAVKEWKQAKMAAASMPVTADLSMEESEAVSGAVWNAVSPIIAKRLTRQNECAESAWEETRREIDRLCQTAEDQLAEEQALKEARLKAEREREREYLEYRNQALSKELEETKAELSRVATELGKERLMLQKAELEVSGLQAAVDTLRQVILVLKQKAIPKMSGKKV